jgi:hypothetical protein
MICVKFGQNLVSYSGEKKFTDGHRTIRKEPLLPLLRKPPSGVDVANDCAHDPWETSLKLYVQFIKALPTLFTIKTSGLGHDDGTDTGLESLYTRNIRHSTA